MRNHSWKIRKVDIKNGIKVDSIKISPRCWMQAPVFCFGRCASLGWNRSLRRSVTFHVLSDYGVLGGDRAYDIIWS